MSRSSSVTVVSPIVKDGVDDIVAKLGDIEGIIGSLSAQSSPEAARAPDMDDLTYDISKLQEEVNSIKLAQDAQIKELRVKVTKDLKDEIAEALEEDVGAVITEAIAKEVEEEMVNWGTQPGVSAFVRALEKMVKENEEESKASKIQLDNSVSRHANSTIDIPDDLNRPLRKIKRRDDSVCEQFPESVGALFSYDGDQLASLLKGYNLQLLSKHSENLNRFLTFIGVTASVPDQLVDFVEEQPPAYPAKDIGGYERIQRSTRRRSSASEKSAGGWYGFFAN